MNANNDNYDESGLPKGNKPNYVVVPIEIWEAENLSWSERVLLVEIDRHTRHGRDCFMSNDYIAHFLNTSERNASKLLNSLIKKGYVVMTRFDGRKRFISSTLETVLGSIPQNGGVSIHQKVDAASTKKATILVNEYNSYEYNNINKKNARAREEIIADIIENNTSWVENQIKAGIEPDDIPALLDFAYDHYINTKGEEPARQQLMNEAFYQVRDFKEHKRIQAIKAIPTEQRKIDFWQQSQQYVDKFPKKLRDDFVLFYTKPSSKDPELMIFEQWPNFDLLTQLKQFKLNDEQRNQRPAL